MAQPFPTDYTWVASHQDDNKKWKHLSLRERMKVIVDRLAKRALINGIQRQEYISNDFPFEQVQISD